MATNTTAIPAESNIPLVFTTISVVSLFGVIFWHTIQLLSVVEQPLPEKQVVISHNELTLQESNLRDQYAYPTEGGSPESWKVKSLWIFPIKSCRGIELKESRVVSTG